MKRALGWVIEFTDSFDKFDYFDRLVVGIYMLVVAMLLVYQLSQQLTVAEQRQIAPAIKFFAWLPFVFIGWPFAREILNRAIFAAVGWFRGDTA